MVFTGNQNEELKFSTLSGILKVRRDDKGNVEMNFPKYELTSLKINGIENKLKAKFPEVSVISRAHLHTTLFFRHQLPCFYWIL